MNTGTYLSDENGYFTTALFCSRPRTNNFESTHYMKGILFLAWHTLTWTRRSSTMIFSFWVNLQNKIFGEKVFCTDVENITQDNCFFLATSAIPFFIAELAGNAKKIFLPNVTASAKCIGLWEKDIPLSLSFLSDLESSHLTELDAMEWFSNNIQQDSLSEN